MVNLNNRSLGLDSECDLTIDAGLPKNGHMRPPISAQLYRLLGEHLDTDPARVARSVLKPARWWKLSMRSILAPGDGSNCLILKSPRISTNSSPTINCSTPKIPTTFLNHSKAQTCGSIGGLAQPEVLASAVPALDNPAAAPGLSVAQGLAVAGVTVGSAHATCALSRPAAKTGAAR